MEALLVSRIVHSLPKLSTLGWWETTTLAEDLGLEQATKDDVYLAHDWLLARKDRIEAQLAQRHLSERSLVLYGAPCQGASCGKPVAWSTTCA